LRIHLINLDRSQDRLTEFVTANRHLTEVVRFPAIDGSSLDIAALAQQGLVAPDILDSYSVGAVGLALSHGTLWQAAATQGQTVTVAEDDTVFHSKFEALAEEVLKSLPPDWDMIFWGWNFDATMMFDVLPGVSPCVAQFDQNKMRAHIPDFQQLPLSPRAHKLLWLFGTGSYTVSPKGAQNLRSRCFPLRPMLITWPEGPAAAGGFGRNSQYRHRRHAQWHLPRFAGIRLLSAACRFPQRPQQVDRPRGGSSRATGSGRAGAARGMEFAEA
jgi:GR25 family glycosyltransferase involved in LPS biosynthesis